MSITFSKNFFKSYEKLSSQIQSKVDKRLEVFGTDEHDPILNNHKLKGEYKNFRSINITGDIRAIYKKERGKIILITFIKLGTHSQLY